MRSPPMSMPAAITIVFEQWVVRLSTAWPRRQTLTAHFGGGRSNYSQGLA